jgi:hypothetical protein
MPKGVGYKHKGGILGKARKMLGLRSGLKENAKKKKKLRAADIEYFRKKNEEIGM